MRQDEINKDLGSYLHTKKDKPMFWKKTTPKIKPHHEFDDEVIVRHELEHADTIKPETKTAATAAPTTPIRRIVNKVEVEHHQEEQVHHDIKPKIAVHEEPMTHHDVKPKAKVEVDDDIEADVKIEEPEKSNPIKKLFQKIGFSKDDEDEGPHQIGHMDTGNNPEITMDDEELRELLHGLHNWIIQLPSDKLERFKTSREFELYTKYLRKHNLIK
jgi:hypothetical protein